ncbi:MAG: hypothetical protein L3J31_06875, partial [Bacteroidales bacterium]|nr:hypothetical protein [Bacteroidales bacterium]
MIKKYVFPLLFSFAFINSIHSQLIVVDPPFPSAEAAATITFNATGTGLEGYSGKVYAHTGLTVNGNSWQNVIGSWGDNDTQPELTEIGTNLYQLDILPTVRDFYGVGTSGNISEMAFVFRSADGTQQTSPDIFYGVYEEILAILITAPETNPLIVQQNDTVLVKWIVNLADSSFLYLDDSLLFAGTGSSFEYKIPVEDFGKKRITAVATTGSDSVSDTFSY